MKKYLLLLIALVGILATGCNSDPVYDYESGFLIVNLEQEGDDEVDFSDYSIALVPDKGYVATDYWKNVTWPVEMYTGTYSVLASSPKISETEKTETYYYGEVKNVVIVDDRTTEITVHLTLQEFPKANQ